MHLVKMLETIMMIGVLTFFFSDPTHVGLSPPKHHLDEVVCVREVEPLHHTL